MRTWSDSPFPAELPLSTIDFFGESLGEGGESHAVRQIAGHPGWVAKLYKLPLPPPRAALLGRLIELPNEMTEDDIDVVDRDAAWPVARITEGGATTGVVLAQSPPAFYVRFNLRGDRQGAPQELQLDHLVNDSVWLARMGVQAPSGRRRQDITRRFLTLGAVLERYDVVYGDWSYRNALWDQNSDDVFLIDLDSCGIGSRPWIASPSWEDPQYPASTPLTVSTDRYRLALLTLRCLTGKRGRPLDGLGRLERDWISGNELPRLLRRAITIEDPQQRPQTVELLAALSDPDGALATKPPAPGSNVTGFRPVPKRAAAPIPPAPQSTSQPAAPPTPAPSEGSPSQTVKQSPRSRGIHPALVVVLIFLAVYLCYLALHS